MTIKSELEFLDKMLERQFEKMEGLDERFQQAPDQYPYLRDITRSHAAVHLCLETIYGILKQLADEHEQTPVDIVPSPDRPEAQPDTS